MHAGCAAPQNITSGASKWAVTNPWHSAEDADFSNEVGFQSVQFSCFTQREQTETKTASLCLTGEKIFLRMYKKKKQLNKAAGKSLKLLVCKSVTR